MGAARLALTLFTLGWSVSAAGATAAALLRDADALLAGGQLRAAEAYLSDARSVAATADERALVEAVHADLTIALGRPGAAEGALAEVLAGLPPAVAPAVRVRLHGSLGVSRALQDDTPGALDALARAARLAREHGLTGDAARVLANAARVAASGGNPERAAALAEESRELADRLGADEARALLLINLGRTWLLTGNTGAERRRALAHYREAQVVGRALDDPRVESFAVGYTAELYEHEQRYGQALALFRRAGFLAQRASADDVLYLWEWGSARVLQRQGRRAAARDSYARAVALLEGLRHQLPFLYGERGAAFQSSVEPVYLGLVAAYVDEAHDTSGSARAAALASARDTLEQLKAAELRNYFGDDCVELAAERAAAGGLARDALVVYPIPLADRLELLVTLPDGSLDIFTAEIGAARLDDLLRSFRALVEKRITREYLAPARQLHAVLIEPFASLLTSGINTLVFVPHGEVATIPLAALHDGRRHLVERFAVAVIPGLELTDPGPIGAEGLNMLLAGLSSPVAGYPSLAHVPEELAAVGALGRGRTLLDAQFRLDSVSDALAREPFNVVHIATHGEFGTDTERSFLLAYDGRLEMADLERYVGLFRYRQQPLELLTLSACDTAAGDRRAALGLSGIAVKAGARSAVGTLWRVNDQSSAQLMRAFYGALAEPGTTRAGALRRAQLTLKDDLRYWHPGYWSAFLVISNWL